MASQLRPNISAQRDTLWEERCVWAAEALTRVMLRAGFFSAWKAAESALAMAVSGHKSVVEVPQWCHADGVGGGRGGGGRLG
jgi:hypothetical protein